jgi:hypothetical protein
MPDSIPKKLDITACLKITEPDKLLFDEGQLKEIWEKNGGDIVDQRFVELAESIRQVLESVKTEGFSVQEALKRCQGEFILQLRGHLLDEWRTTDLLFTYIDTKEGIKEKELEEIIENNFTILKEYFGFIYNNTGIGNFDLRKEVFASRLALDSLDKMIASGPSSSQGWDFLVFNFQKIINGFLRSIGMSEWFALEDHYPKEKSAVIAKTIEFLKVPKKSSKRRKASVKPEPNLPRSAPVLRERATQTLEIPSDVLQPKDSALKESIPPVSEPVIDLEGPPPPPEMPPEPEAPPAAVFPVASGKPKPKNEGDKARDSFDKSMEIIKSGKFKLKSRGVQDKESEQKIKEAKKLEEETDREKMLKSIRAGIKLRPTKKTVSQKKDNDTVS